MDDDRLHELFASIGPIRIRRMFGGNGIYADGMIVAVVVGDVLMLKADGQSSGAFDEAGSTQWTYAREGRAPVRMPYWTLPDDGHDDPAVMERFASLALEAARRARSETSRAKTSQAKTFRVSARKRPGRADPPKPS